MYSNKKLILPILSLISFCQLISFDLRAQGDLLIYPKRIVFNGDSRSQDLSLVNNGTDTARYVISVIQIRMKQDGSFETISQPDSGQQFADKNIRFFPRQVVLGPKESQTVKVQLIQFGQLAKGEYRSHLYFRAEKQEKPLGEENQPSNSGSISIKIKPIYGISIPVLIKAGESDTRMTLSDISFSFFKDGTPILQLNLGRTGNMSVYGDISIDHISAEGKETRVAHIKGIAVYTPNSSRTIRLALDNKIGIDYTKGALHIVFTDDTGKTQKLVQEQIFL